MKRALFGLALLPLFAGSAFAATGLSESQLDVVTAGDIFIPTLPIGVACDACNYSYSSSNSNNGVTTSSSSSGTVGDPTSGSGNGGSGGSGGSGGATSPAVQLPAAALAAINQSSITVLAR